MHDEYRRINNQFREERLPEIVRRLKDLVDIGRASTEETMALFEINRQRQEIYELQETLRRAQSDISNFQESYDAMRLNIKSMRALINRYKTTLNNVVRECNEAWEVRNYQAAKPKDLDNNSSLWDAAVAILETTEKYEDVKPDRNRLF